jgi:hypothetical protein
MSTRKPLFTACWFWLLLMKFIVLSFPVNAEGMSPTCLPGARERAGMEGAHAGARGRAAGERSG